MSTASDLDGVNDSYDTMTIGEMFKKRQKLLSDAATRLGEILFAYGAFERQLDFCIVWVGAGQGMDKLASRIKDFSLDKKIEILAKFVDQIFENGSEQHSAYHKWIVTAHAIRLNRNDLAHGWWDIDDRRNEVINYRGIASAEHREQRYTLHGLELFEQTIRAAASKLCQLRERFPLETSAGILGEGGF